MLPCRLDALGQEVDSQPVHAPMSSEDSVEAVKAWYRLCDKMVSDDNEPTSFHMFCRRMERLPAGGGSMEEVYAAWKLQGGSTSWRELLDILL